MGFPFKVAAQTSIQESTFDTLRLGKNSQTICARLLRFWRSEKFSRSIPFNGITLTFVDYKGSMINGLQAANCLALLQEDTVYTFSHFEVAKCSTMYKTTEHPYVIRFLHQTIIEPVKDKSSGIQSQQFMVRTCDQLHMLADTNLELPDVFGCIKSVKSYGLNITGVLEPVLLRLQIPGEAELELVLLDHASAIFRRLLNSTNKPQCAMLFTSVNPKRIGGYASTSYSHTRVDVHSLVLGQMHDLSLIDVGGTVNASQISTIGDLGTFLGNTEAKDPLLSCKARIIDIIYPNGWFTISCVACEQPLLCSSGQQECTQTSPRCVVRYQIELLVDDGQNYAVFTLGDKDILGLINQEASSLLNQEALNTNDRILPPALEKLRGVSSFSMS